MAFSFELKLAISSELYGAISAGPEQRLFSGLHQYQQSGIALSDRGSGLPKAGDLMAAGWATRPVCR